MLDDGEKLVPGFRQARALRVWTGVRPLFEDAKASDTDTRDVTRAHALLDHAERDGVSGFVTITGGKLTTFRLMAEETMDAVCRHLGEERPCTTKTEPLPGSEDGRDLPARRATRAARRRSLADEQLICECEMVPRRSSRRRSRRRATTNLDDIRRLLRLGDGTVPGRLLHLPRHRDPARARRAQRRAGRRVAAATSSRSGGRGCGRSCTATSSARPGSTTGSSRACSTWSICRVMRGELHYDAVVIGAGTAGLVAGARLAEGGARVCVLAKGVGSTHLAPGTIDVLGYAPDRVAGARARRSSRSGGAPARSSLRAARRRRGRGGGERGSPDASPPGRCPATGMSATSSTTCCCRPRSARCARRRSCPRRWPPATRLALQRVCIVGTRSLRDFHPALCAANLGRAGVDGALGRASRSRSSAPTRTRSGWRGGSTIQPGAAGFCRSRSR